MESLRGQIRLLGWLVRLRLRVARAAWPGVLIQGVIIPLLFFLLLAHQAHRLDTLRLAIGASIVSALTLALRRVAHQNVSDKVTGRAALLRTCAIPVPVRLLGQVIDGVIVGSISIAPLAIAIALGVIPEPKSIGLLFLFGLGLVVFSMAGAAIGDLSRRMSEVNLLTTLLVLFAAAFCPVFYGYSQVPGVIAPLVAALPPSLEASGMFDVWRGDVHWLPAVGMAFWLVAAAGLALWTAKRSTE